VSQPRLQTVEDQADPRNAPASSSGGGDNGGIEARLAALETRIEYLATKEDIQKLKVWVLGGVVSAFVTGLGFALVVM